MRTAPARRPVSGMTVVELLAEAEAHKRAQDHQALATPATLARHLRDGYRSRAHLRAIGAAMARLRERPNAKLIITTPPQVGKTVTAVEFGAFWWLCHHPTDRVIIGSYNKVRARKRGKAVRRLVADDGHRYGLALARGSTAADEWDLTTGGGVLSVGVGSGVTGEPGNFVILDDPLKNRKEAQSVRIRETLWDWLSADVRSRMSPGAPMVIIMTRWHPDDPVGRLLAEEGTDWEVLHLPALAGANDPLGRRPGDPLPHPRIDADDPAAALAHWTEKRRTTIPRDWAALYQGEPAPTEGTLLSEEVLRRQRCYTSAPACGPCATERVKTAVAVDPSGGGRDTAGIIAGHRGDDDRLYLTHDRSGVMPSEQWSREACILAAEIDADRVIVETNFGGDLALLAIKTAWASLMREAEAGAVWRLAVTGETGRTRDGHPGRWVPVDPAVFARLPPRVQAVRARAGKLLRAEPIAQQWMEDRVRTAAYLPELEQEYATWQPDDPDSPGRLDASVYLGYALLRVPRVGQQAGGASAAGVSRTAVTRRGQAGRGYQG